MARAIGAIRGTCFRPPLYAMPLSVRILAGIVLAVLLLRRLGPLLLPALRKARGRSSLLLAMVFLAAALYAGHIVDLAKAGVHPDWIHPAQGVIIVALIGFVVSLATMAGASAPSLKMPDEVAQHLDALQSQADASAAFFNHWSTPDIKTLRSLIVATPEDAQRYGVLLRRLDEELRRKRSDG